MSTKHCLHLYSYDFYLVYIYFEKFIVFIFFQGLTIVKPIVYGNVARYFGKKREEDGHTHQWTVYVKPYNNEDMSTYVKKVHFKLHESYNNPNRIVTKPPYELTETGWGEFEIVIKIYFHDQNERPVCYANFFYIGNKIRSVFMKFKASFNILFLFIFYPCFR